MIFYYTNELFGFILFHSPPPVADACSRYFLFNGQTYVGLLLLVYCTYVSLLCRKLFESVFGQLVSNWGNTRGPRRAAADGQHFQTGPRKHIKVLKTFKYPKCFLYVSII